MEDYEGFWFPDFGGGIDSWRGDGTGNGDGAGAGGGFGVGSWYGIFSLAPQGGGYGVGDDFRHSGKVTRYREG